MDYNKNYQIFHKYGNHLSDITQKISTIAEHLENHSYSIEAQKSSTLVKTSCDLTSQRSPKGRTIIRTETTPNLKIPEELKWILEANGFIKLTY